MIPVLEFMDMFDSFPNNSFPSHWHHEFELQIILSGCAEYNVNGIPYKVEKGCAIYIAPEAVHFAKGTSAGTIGYNILVLPQLLIKLLASANCEKFTVPLTTRQPEALVITNVRKEGLNVLELLKKMYHAENSILLHELIFLESVIGIWRNLLTIFPPQTPSAKDSGMVQREQRMKEMLNFIQQNYAQPITISEIATAANISRSECFRCFAELSKISPVEYVTQFRLLEASQLLVTSDKSIADICYTTGFNNTSYFSKKFKMQYGMTPKEYRSKNHN